MAAVRETMDVMNTVPPDIAKMNVVRSMLSNNLGI